MANMLQYQTIQCPYCWQSLEIAIDCSVEQQDYIEDCQVCCRPIVLSVSIDKDENDEAQPTVIVRSEDE